ncbi:YcgN family cysteine cluster protein [Pontivivens nitratireducens]|uniref:YcgN family cysteine cluster protein n=1 Tax=Pontivivens nitratireducens TaxID=2758038 RepID=UPI00163ABD17|nr:YcgN family cysteine cluster protein [Pontibrevibacter nitratireducens]
MTHRPKFWTLPLDALTRPEWEALCDGCGKCCLLKLEDEETGGVAYTDIACRLFDPATCRCGNYALRKQLVPGCVVLDAETLPQIAHWMPQTCAYRLRHEGKPIPDWHPLMTGDMASVAKAGHSMAGRTVAEFEVDEEEYEEHIVEDLS